MAKSKSFTLAEILSVITKIVFESFLPILKFMTKRDIKFIDIPHIFELCTPCLLAQFPVLVDPELNLAIAELKLLLAKSKEGDKKSIKEIWLKKQVEKYGEIFEVLPLPPGVLEGKVSIEKMIVKMSKK